jgi:hypothetical protein
MRGDEAIPHFVIPAKAGTQEILDTLRILSWVPDSRFALSGMTQEGDGDDDFFLLSGVDKRLFFIYRANDGPR